MIEYTHTYDVTFSDIDQNFGLPINAVLGIYTDAIARQLAIAGIGPADLHRMGYLWVIVEFHSKIVGRMPRWTETFTVKTAVTELSAVRVFVTYSMENSDGEVFAHGDSVWVVMDKKARKPVKSSVLEPLSGLLNRDAGVHSSTFKFSAIGEEIDRSSHLITNMDTDFNGHMNNQSYVKLAMSMAPVSFTASHDVCDFHVKFGHESFLGDTLVTVLKKNGEGHLSAIITKEVDGAEVCRIESIWKDKVHNIQ